mgnify:CR=1 FL=1
MAWVGRKATDGTQCGRKLRPTRADRLRSALHGALFHPPDPTARMTTPHLTDADVRARLTYEALIPAMARAGAHDVHEQP